MKYFRYSRKSILEFISVYWVIVWIALSGFAPLTKAPSILYLTWMHDPTTTMTVQWHSDNQDFLSQVYYRKVGEEEWLLKEGIYAPLPKRPVLVHTVELDGLDPGTQYQFFLGGRKGEFQFSTLPSSLSHPVKFVVGGDVYFYLSKMRKMNLQVAACNPDFVVIGGDIAYTYGSRAVFSGRRWQVDRWRRFLKEWSTQMVTKEGRLIPLLVLPGNHDVRGTSLTEASYDELFYQLFAFAERGVSYRVFDIGNYLSLFLLDSGHHYNISGQQTQWLQKQLQERQAMPYQMAAYHISAYPSVYPYIGATSQEIRAQWCPLFEKHHLQVAFEHHNHAYKRTYPLKGDRIDPEGVIYMGDGSWGVSPRQPKKLWYLDRAAKVNAVCLVTLTSEKGQVEAVNAEGQVIDYVDLVHISK